MSKTTLMKIMRRRLAPIASLLMVFGLLGLLLAPLGMAADRNGSSGEALISSAADFCDAAGKGSAPARDAGHAQCCICCGCSERPDNFSPYLLAGEPDLERADPAIDLGRLEPAAEGSDLQAAPPLERPPGLPRPEHQSRKHGAVAEPVRKAACA
jgi:hypothetical protein